MERKKFLGIEFGSTRIKAVCMDDGFAPISSGDYTWASTLINGVWTYDLAEVWQGLKAALAPVEGRESLAAAGISGMMHGYLAFDKDWKLLTPFRTWQNTMTGQASEALTALFGFNIPQRWSIAHLYQAVLNCEAHVESIAHITTLAGYVHYMLTGMNVVGIGEASGIFPIDSAAGDYDREMMRKFNELPEIRALPWTLEQLLPEVRLAGEAAGALTPHGAVLLDGLLKEGLPFAPPEGDAGTGMAATNSVAPGSGNVSAGTSIFAMVVLDKMLSRVYPEIDMVTTPSGKPVAMVHCNNCTSDMNAWVGMLGECAALFGAHPDAGELFTRLYQKSLEGAEDCGGITVCNYQAGEPVTGFDCGRPFVVREPSATLCLADFLRAQLYSTLTTLSIGMELLREEQVEIARLMGHGGLFKTPVVGQAYLAAATGAPVCVMRTAGEGGPYGMAILASYLVLGAGMTLEDYLDKRVFSRVEASELKPEEEAVEGFRRYLVRFKKALAIERAAIDSI